MLWALMMAQAWASGDGGAPAPRTYEVSANYFREHYLATHAIADVPVTLSGEWTDAQVYRLGEVLRVLNAKRTRRHADIREYSHVLRLHFRVGDQFSYRMDEEIIPNPAGIWGSGISAIEDHHFEIPFGVDDQEVMGLIGPKLPEILIKDERRLKAWQKVVARAMRPSVCAGLVSALGFGRR